MRSSRALRLLYSAARTSHVPYQGRRRAQVISNGYCSSCEPGPAPSSAATATLDPPTPPADHRQFGIELELFTTSNYSPGSPLFLPNGARMFNKLTNFLRAQYEQFGFEEVITPTIYKKSLWEKSGHWENYAEDMYSVTGRGATGETEGRQIGEDEEYGLKPMNCPGHCLIFASKKRSYRDLPIRYADFSPLHRNELSGALSGLTRVRRFHQDDGHIFCRPSQIREEISSTLEFVQMTYAVLGLGPYRLTLSTRPKDHFIGSIEEWDNAEMALRESLNASGQVWMVNEGDGAFYGPKIDIILKDSDGKEHQTATIQLDFQLPKRFELEYQAPAPALEQKGIATTNMELLATEGSVTPVLIHRAVLGSVERIMALLIEHYNSHWPLWLNPRQVAVLTVTNDEAVMEYVRANLLGDTKDRPSSEKAFADHRLHNEKFHYGAEAHRGDYEQIPIHLDDTARPLGQKISEAKRKHYGVLVVVGKKDVSRDRVMVDFTGIPDPQGMLRESRFLRRILAEHKILANGGQLNNLSAEKEESFPILTQEELKSFPIAPNPLLQFFRILTMSYM